MNEEQISSEELLEFIAACDAHDEAYMKQQFIDIFVQLTELEIQKAS